MARSIPTMDASGHQFPAEAALWLSRSGYMLSWAVQHIGQKKKLALRFWTGHNWQNAPRHPLGGAGGVFYATWPWEREVSDKTKAPFWVVQP